ncbi:MAG: glycine betaine ABC transporter substrate-binding protein [Ktedonobacterales bacterium]
MQSARIPHLKMVLGVVMLLTVLTIAGCGGGGSGSTSSNAETSSTLRLGLQQDALSIYQAVDTAYGLKWKSTTYIDESLSFAAVTSGSIDINECYTTDPSILVDNFVLLTDTKNAFPPYNPAPIVRDSTLAKSPVIATTLNGLESHLNTAEQTGLIQKVSVDHDTVLSVAQAFLQSQGLLSSPSKAGAGINLKIGSKNDPDGQLLAEMYSLLLANQGFNVTTELALGQTPVLSAAIQSGAIDMYPEFTGTGLSIGSLPNTTNPQTAYNEVSTYYQQKYNITWLAAAFNLNDSYGYCTSKANASKYHLSTIADLAKPLS